MKNLLFLLLCSVAMLFAQEAAPDWMAIGNAAYESFDDAKAVASYEAIIAVDSNNCEALWKASRSHVIVGELEGKAAQETHYPKAEKLARRAAVLCPENVDTQLNLAIAVGRLAILRGGKTKVELSKEVKERAEKAIQLNPQEDIAYHVLARWNREVAILSGVKKALAKIIYGGLPPASREKAVELFQQAIAIDPNYIIHHYELGLTYETLGKWAEAKSAYEQALHLTAVSPRDKKYQAEAKQQLERVMKKL
ncbi:MAG TPA: tetratricopeptide repeat protein [bacterium]|nr:tetratricopeptide repeat protein [bacterium]HNT64244.1 tetratricopeptide repeat protein [bacterium]HOX85234.1 tetratricopeptide repeat protein [bacterium]HPG44393.1 tetratricopeptide repeat protein [bacterium]HPM96951.1 tetratricopeptide repeat protein [bacterium]